MIHGPQPVRTWTGEIDVLATARAIDQWRIEHAVEQYSVELREHERRRVAARWLARMRSQATLHRLQEARRERESERRRRQQEQDAWDRQQLQIMQEAKALREAKAALRNAKRAERRAYAQPLYGGHDEDRYREPRRYYTERRVVLDEVLDTCAQLKQLRIRPSEALHVFGTHSLRDTLNEARRRYG